MHETWISVLLGCCPDGRREGLVMSRKSHAVQERVADDGAPGRRKVISRAHSVSYAKIWPRSCQSNRKLRLTVGDDKTKEGFHVSFVTFTFNCGIDNILVLNRKCNYIESTHWGRDDAVTGVVMNSNSWRCNCSYIPCRQNFKYTKPAIKFESLLRS